MSDQKKQPTTISRKKYEELERQLRNAAQTADNLRAERNQMRDERDKAQSHAMEMEKMSYHHQQRANEAEVRASRAEGYASALLDKVYSPRPELPWEKPQRVDQWGNPVYG